MEYEELMNELEQFRKEQKEFEERVLNMVNTSHVAIHDLWEDLNRLRGRFCELISQINKLVGKPNPKTKGHGDWTKRE